MGSLGRQALGTVGQGGGAPRGELPAVATAKGGGLRRGRFVRVWDAARQALLGETTIAKGSPREAGGYACEPLATGVPRSRDSRHPAAAAEQNGRGAPWLG